MESATRILTIDDTRIGRLKATAAFAAAALVLMLLALLHALSPELAPSWRMVSEYAMGQHAWLLTLMFFTWAASSWALAWTLRPHVNTRMGKAGWIFLILAGIGQIMGGLFDINHPLHGFAAMIGIPSLCVAAVLLTLALTHDGPETWRHYRRSLLAAAHLTWISFVLMIATTVLFFVTYAKAGGDTTSGKPPLSLPVGTIAFHGWANRLLFLTYCGWTMLAAFLLLKRTR